MSTDENAEIEGPAPGGVGLLIIDMINDLDFPGAEGMTRQLGAASAAILALRDEADRLHVPVVYVNDNHGQWHSERSRIIDHCLRPDSPGRAVVEQIKPRPNDFFVIKPQFSGFYATNLPVLLPRLKITRLILTGVAADICVLFTAADAHMREYGLWVPGDAVASNDEQRRDWALEIMKTSMAAQTSPTSELSLADWTNNGSSSSEGQSGR